MRRSLVVGNWKMNMLISDATDWVESLLRKPPFPEAVEVVANPKVIAFTTLFVTAKSGHKPSKATNAHFQN